MTLTKHWFPSHSPLTLPPVFSNWNISFKLLQEFITEQNNVPLLKCEPSQIMLFICGVTSDTQSSFQKTIIYTSFNPEFFFFRN